MPFEGVTLADIPFGREAPIIINAHLSVLDAFETLVRENIHSAPVIDASEKTYVGIISLEDLAGDLVKLFVAENPSSLPGSLEHLLSQVDAFACQAHIGACIKEHHRNFARLSLSTPLMDALAYFSHGLEGEKPLRCLPVVDDDGVIVKMIGQSAIVEFLEKRAIQGESPLLISMLHRKIADFPQFSHPLVTVTEDVLAIHALQKMLANKVSCVPIVDEDEMVITCFSMSDIKAVFIANDFRVLLEPVMRVATTVRQQLLKAMVPCINVHPSHTLHEAVDKLVATQVHHLWVTEESEHPHAGGGLCLRAVGVVTQNDIIRVVFTEFSA